MVSYLDKEVLTIDLGCGVGQTAGLLHSLGFEKYYGVDFSMQAIKLAVGCDGVSHPGYSFTCADILEFSQLPVTVKAQYFISETLEHIICDTELLENLTKSSPGSMIALSVPTFNDPAHVRHFKGVKDAVDRYSPFIDVEVSKQIGPWIVICGTLIKPL